MNPSADDFVKAFDSCNADNIIVFPNNGNVILTAKQAADLFEGSHVVVIPSKSVVHASSALQMTALQSYSLDANVANIDPALPSVVSGEVSTAVRDSLNNGPAVKKGDAIGILSGELVNDTPNPVDCLLEPIAAVDDIADRSVITVFFGKQVGEAMKEEVEERLSKAYPLMDYQPFDGGQDVYPFIFAVE